MGRKKERGAEIRRGWSGAETISAQPLTIPQANRREERGHVSVPSFRL
jgi:hypothetical protein